MYGENGLFSLFDNLVNFVDGGDRDDTSFTPGFMYETYVFVGSFSGGGAVVGMMLSRWKYFEVN